MFSLEPLTSNLQPLTRIKRPNHGFYSFEAASKEYLWDEAVGVAEDV
jgi:hypothetical protein